MVLSGISNGLAGCCCVLCSLLQCVSLKKKKVELTVMSSFWLRFIGLTAKVIDRTKTMADVYGAFFDFASMLESKV